MFKCSLNILNYRIQYVMQILIIDGPWGMPGVLVSPPPIFNVVLGERRALEIFTLPDTLIV